MQPIATDTVVWSVYVCVCVCEPLYHMGVTIPHGKGNFERFFKMAAIRHLKFLKVVLMLQREIVHQHAKFRADWSRRCGDMTVFFYF